MQHATPFLFQLIHIVGIAYFSGSANANGHGMDDFNGWIMGRQLQKFAGTDPRCLNDVQFIDLYG